MTDSRLPRPDHEALLKSLPEAVVALDGTARIVYWGAEAGRIFGFTENEVVGQPFSFLLVEQPLFNSATFLERLKADQPDVRPRQVMGRTRNEEQIPLELSVSFFETPNGPCYPVILHNITERRQAEQALLEKNRLVMLLQSVAIASNQARSAEEAMQTCLVRICEYTGWPLGHVYLRSAEDPDELLPSRIWALSDPAAFEEFRRVTEATTFRNGIGLPGQVLARRGPVWVTDVADNPQFRRTRTVQNLELRSGFAFPVWVGDEIVAVLEFFSTDPEAPRTPFWEVIVPIANQLGQVIQRQRNEDRLRNLTTRLEQSNKELQDFAFIASHDLQEPLRKIQAFGDRLRSIGVGSGDQARDYLDRINRAAERMQRLINDLLAFSRVGTQGREFLETDLNEVAQGVLSDLEARIEETGARIEVGRLPRIEADAVQMSQLLQNLVSNAVKFHRDGVVPLVSITAEIVSPPDQGRDNRGETTHCRLLVSDNGIGFEEKYAERIFNIFERLHGRDKYEGTGMGLATCRKIVERHHGTIQVSSTPGHGTRFIVTLPVRQNQNEGFA